MIDSIISECDHRIDLDRSACGKHFSSKTIPFQMHATELIVFPEVDPALGRLSS